MKRSCETFVIDILPVVRKELTMQLINKYKLTSAQVARMFGITDTSISQYLRGIRGSRSILEEGPHYDRFMDELAASAEMLATKNNTVGEELCRICTFVRRSGLFEHLQTSGDKGSMTVCIGCPRDGP
jgi:predicted transcriptional regulator